MNEGGGGSTGASFYSSYPQTATVVTACLVAATSVLVVQAGLGGVLVLHRTDWQLFAHPDYYTVLTGHGVLALAFTSFGICGIFNWAITDSLDTPPRPRLVWPGVSMLAGGTVLLIGTLMMDFFAGVRASVLYTFYPPLRAHPAFYLGLTVLIGGMWLVGVAWIETWQRWRQNHEDDQLPLRAFMVVVTTIVWFLSSFGVAVEVGVFLIPWSVGLLEGVNALLARTLFWTFGQALGYFWLLAVYLVLYTVLPNVTGGRLISDSTARGVFIVVLVVGPSFGFHHQYLDPGIPSAWKYAAFLKMLLLSVASLVTVFTVLASLEYGSRVRDDRGSFQWLYWLPWRDPVFASIALGGVSLAIGGMSGVVNAIPHLNYVVHNSLWVVGHFHFMIAGGLVSVFVGMIYWLLPRVTGRQLRLRRWAVTQSYLWFCGIVAMGTVMQVMGVSGGARRTAVPNIELWTTALVGYHGSLRMLLAISGGTMVLSVIGVAVVLGVTLRSPLTVSGSLEWNAPLSRSNDATKILSDLRIWSAVSLGLVILMYAVIFSIFYSS